MSVKNREEIQHLSHLNEITLNLQQHPPLCFTKNVKAYVHAGTTKEILVLLLWFMFFIFILYFLGWGKLLLLLIDIFV